MTNRPNLLVVDDDAPTREATVRLLTKAGYPVNSATTGSEGLHLVQTQQPSLVLLDVVLPDIPGPEVLRVIRSQPELAAVEVVFLSAQRTQPAHQMAGLDAGAIGYITRPIGNEELLARVRAYWRMCEQADAVRASEARFRNLITHLADGVVVVDPRGVIQFANPTAERLFARTRAELTGSPFGFPIGGQDSAEIELRQPQGQLLHVEMRVEPTTWDRRPAWLAALRDLTERKRAEAALEEAIRFSQQVIENMRDGVIVYGPDLRYQVWNIAMEKISGKPATEVIGRRPEELFPFLEETGVLARVKDCLATGATHSVDFPYHIPHHNRSGWFSDSSSPLRDTAGAIIGVISTVRDITERKRAEAALSESEQRFREIAETVNEVFWVVAADWSQVHYVSPAYERMWGRSVQSLYRQPLSWLDALHRDDREAARLDVETKIHPNNAALDFAPYRVVRPDGSIRWVLAKLFPILDRDGQVARVVGIARDITELKEAEEKLRELNGRLLLATASAKAGVWDWNLQTGEMIWDDRMLDLYGLRRETFPGGVGAWEQGLHPDDASRAKEECQAALRGEREFDTEFRVRRPDGTVVHIKANGLVLRDEQGRPHRMIGLNTDITERKLADEAVRTRDLQFRTVLERMPLIGVILDRVGCITLCNDFVLQLTGWQREEVINRNWFELFLPPEVREQVRGEVFLMSIDAGEVPVTFENEIVTRKGERRLVSWHNTVLRESSGRVLGVASIGDDITQRRRAEEEKERLQAQLLQAQKMESIGRLAGGVAHDFNNMLAAILVNANLALREAPTGSLRENLQEIEECAKRSADLTRQLLAFARKQTIAPKVLDLNATMEGMLKMLRRLIGEDIDLVWRPSPDLWPIKLDPSQIDQILANLCVNARDAINGVGEVTMETANVTVDDSYTAEQSGFVSGDYARLSVSDTGCGMDKETLSHLFEPFFTTKGLGQGTGLGLATVYGIVRQNNGFINVISEPGRGTTFELYLPRHAAKVAHGAVVGATRAVIGGLEIILLVEDEASLLRVTRRALAGLGYTVLAASTPGEAIHLAEEHSDHIHLLITDLVMPGMNGWELAKRLLSLYPNLKCLFMSGYTADVLSHQDVLREGIQFLQKPFAVEALADKVREAIGSS